MRDEPLVLCRSITRDRLSATEEIDEQTVNLVTHDVAYVVTRSVQTTRWKDGRTQVLPTVETDIVARQVTAGRFSSSTCRGGNQHRSGSDGPPRHPGGERDMSSMLRQHGRTE